MFVRIINETEETVKSIKEFLLSKDFTEKFGKEVLNENNFVYYKTRNIFRIKLINGEVKLAIVFYQKNKDELYLNSYKITADFSKNYYVNLDYFGGSTLETKLKLLLKDLDEAICNEWK